VIPEGEFLFESLIMWYILGFVCLAVNAAVFWARRAMSVTTIYDFEKGLLYKNGAYVKALDAGRYRYLKSRTKIESVDMRKLPFTLSGQEVLTKDHVSLRMTTVGQFQINDIELAVRKTLSHQAELYTMAQLALREAIGKFALNEVLEKKAELNALLLSAVQEGAKPLGLDVLSFAIRDVMLPANLKKAFAGALEAQKEAQRQLEMARGEQAVLRSLANSTKLYENNPTLLKARVIQALSSGNNSIVFSADEKITLNKTRAK
jgi:regulator of protease activity HflC (stomatin/prohibitin superfamily)